MNKEELLGRLTDIEWDDFEVKEARSELPKNIWETVSAFANAAGGWVILGVTQKGKKFEITGVENPEKLEQDFTTVLRSKSKFNVLIIDSISENPYITSEELAVIIGIRADKIRVNLAKLKAKGLLERVGPDKGGYWKAIGK